MKLVSSILFVIMLVSIHAQDYKKIVDSKICKEQIQKKHKSLASLSASFTETVYSRMFDQPQKGNGKLLYKKENKVRWEKSSPKKQVILISGNVLKMSEDGKEVTNASAKKSVKRIQDLMVSTLSGEFLNEKKFAIVYYENTGNYKLILTPKSVQMAKYIKQIVLIFDKKSLMLEQMSMVEDEKNKVIYDFSNLIENLSIAESKFTTF